MNIKTSFFIKPVNPFMKKTIMILAVCSAIIGGCGKTSTSPSFTPDCSGASKSYKTDIQPIFQSYCVGCHSVYSTYSGVASNTSAIRSKIVDASMPQGTSLSTTQKNAVVCWIDNGALNN